MKKLLFTALMFAFTSMLFAQKNEIKAIEKALKQEDYATAKSAIPAAEGLLSNMDDKTKAKFYALKAKAFFKSGVQSDVDTAIESFEMLKSIEEKSGKNKYTSEITTLAVESANTIFTKASENFQNKNFPDAASGFEKVYKISPKDTVYLYYAASAAVSGQDYDTALEYYNKLKDLKYTGIETLYTATNKETGQVENFLNETARDISVKVGTHIKPEVETTDSKFSEIVKNIALIYVSKGETDKALAAMADAKRENPDDTGLIITEANIYLKMGDRETFRKLMLDATVKEPDNAELQYNLGVLAGDAKEYETAKNYYNKAISLDPNYADAYNNLAVLILNKSEDIVEEMNSLGNSAADNRKYEELKEQRTQLYKDAIPFLTKAFDLKPRIETAETLKSIYSVLGETAKLNEIKAKIEAMQASN